ncbi:MAG: penicillin acylase family protein [Gemmatimonadaceae bacterium]|nr:penicillin acylase family protein [Gemmatimonadaceae bacterium]
MRLFVNARALPAVAGGLIALSTPAPTSAAPPATWRPASGASTRAADSTLSAAGLRAPVTLTRDTAGVVHIRAANEHDLFFAQGWSVARDRLFQLEQWRRFATGTWAEVLGPRALSVDRAMRQLRYRGSLAADLAWYHPRGAAIVQAFVDGINAYIALTEADPSRLSPEFALLGLTPGRWTPAVVVSRHNGLFGNANEELDVAKARRLFGDEVVTWLGRGVLDVARIARDPAVAAPDDLLDDYRPNLRFGLRPDDVRADARRSASRTESWATRFLEGSNNWVLAGAHTASGKPLVANDPHRVIAAPSLRYLVHLSAPGWEVAGAGEPALPGVAIGRNRAGAWGLTIWSIDNEDIIAYPLDATDSLRYRTRTGWQRFVTERDTIRVRGAAPQVVEHLFTVDGPVIRVDRAAGRAYAMRRGANQIGTAPYLASLRLDQARSWPEFRAALEFARAPSLNWVWGDTSGTIGWQVAGYAPKRRGYGGATVVPGDSTFDWTGTWRVADLPNRTAKGSGFVHSANENNAPSTYPHQNAVAPTGWAETFRADRVAEVLRQASKATWREMAALQYDETSLPSRLLRPHVLRVTPRTTRATEALAVVRAWNGVLDSLSVGATIYRATQTGLQTAVERRLTRGQPSPVPISIVGTAAWLDAHATEAAPIVDSVFHATVEQLATTRGPDIATWRFGDVRHGHRTAIRHPLSRAVVDSLRTRFDMPPRARGGDGDTPHATGDGAEQLGGASFRIVADLVHLDSTWVTNVPGQSGDVRSRYYANLYDGWVRGAYVRLSMTTAAIAEATAAVTELRPASVRPAPARGGRAGSGR